MEEREENLEKLAFYFQDEKLSYLKLKQKYPRCADLFDSLIEKMNEIIDKVCTERYVLVGK